MPRRSGADRRWLALAVTATSSLMIIIDATVMNVALPRIQSSLHFSATDLSWVMNAYTLTVGGLLLLGGRAGDVFGRRRLFLGGVALFTVASLAGGLAPSAGWLLVARVAQGVGAAAAGPNTIALVATTFTDARGRLRALALISAVNSSGFAVGLVVGGLLTSIGSWRWVLFINVPFGLAALLLAPRLIRETARHRARLDLAGAATASVGVTAIVDGLVHAASSGWSTAATVLPLLAGVLLLGVFVATEARSAQPLMPLWLFTDRNRAAAYLSFFLGPAAMMSMFFFLTQFLQDIRGYDALTTGFAFLPMAGGMFAMTRVVPTLLARFGPRPLALAGTALLVTGQLWLAQLTPASGYLTGLLPPMLLLGLGGGLAFVPLVPVIVGTVPPAHTGAASGVLQTMQQMGATVGLSVLVTVFGSVVGSSADPSGPETVVTGMTTAFAVAAAIAATAFAAALTFRRVVKPQ